MPYRLNPFTGELDLVLGPGEGTGATDFQSDSGNAVPTLAGVITMAGGIGINTSASGSTVTFNLDDPVIVDNGGTGRTSLTDGAILIGDGSNPVELIGPLIDGQLLIGDTAGVSPVAATLTAGTGITITNGAGSIQIDASGSMATDFDTDSGTATPASNTLNVIGSGLVDTSGSGNTVTINVDSPVVVANGGTGATSLTDGGILLGSGTSPVTVTSQPTDGQLLIGSTGLDPVLAVLTSTGSTIAITNGSGSINLETGSSVSNSFPTDSGTAVPSSGALTVAGGTLIGTTGAGATVTVNADDNVVGSVASDSGTATPSSNSFTIAGSGGISTSGSSDTITIDGSGISGGLTWNEVTGTTQAAAVNNGYVANNASLVVITLPATASFGDIVHVVGKGAGLWALTANTGQTIIWGDQTTTSGGEWTATQQYDAMQVLCTVANTTWTCTGVAQGNPVAT